MAISASLGSLLLGATDTAGVRWTLGNLDGWDSPEIRAALADREGDHGSFWAPVFFGFRPVTLTGTISAPDAASLDAACEQAYAAVSLTDTTLVVNETIPKQAVVRRSGKVLVTRETDLVATYSFLVTAADPRRYDVNLQSQTTPMASTSGGLVLPATLPWTLSATTVNGAITATNSGTFDTRPVLTITGPVSQPSVIARYPDGTVRSMNYTGPDLTATDQLVIDVDSRSVTQNGASRRQWMSFTGPRPVIPAGTTVAYQLRAAAYSAPALLTATWRSAWT